MTPFISSYWSAGKTIQVWEAQAAASAVAAAGADKGPWRVAKVSGRTAQVREDLLSLLLPTPKPIGLPALFPHPYTFHIFLINFFLVLVHLLVFVFFYTVVTLGVVWHLHQMGSTWTGEVACTYFL